MLLNFCSFQLLLFSRSASTIDSWLGNPRLEGKSLRCSFLVGNYLNVKFDFVLGKHVLLCIRLTQVNYLRRRKKSDTNVAQCTSDREAVKLFALGQLKHCCAGRCCQNSFNHCGHCVAGDEGKAYECSSPSLPFVKVHSFSILYLLHGSASGEVASMDEHIAMWNFHLKC